jgi:hypothetical protein
MTYQSDRFKTPPATIPQATLRRAEQAVWEAYDQARRMNDPALEQFAAIYTALGEIARNRGGASSFATSA